MYVHAQSYTIYHTGNLEQKELEDGEVHTKLKRTNEPLGFIEKQFKNLSTYGERRKTII